MDLGNACGSYAAVSGLSLNHDFHEEVKAEEDCGQSHYPLLLGGHPGLAKYHTVWATFSRYFLLDSFSMACTIQIVSAYVSVMATSWQITSIA